jgi:hypothetical protein
MSADTFQADLSGSRVRERPPTDARAAVLDRYPADAELPPSVPWVRLAEEGDTAQVLGWIRRAGDEGVI